MVGSRGGGGLGVTGGLGVVGIRRWWGLGVGVEGV